MSLLHRRRKRRSHRIRSGSVEVIQTDLPAWFERLHGRWRGSAGDRPRRDAARSGPPSPDRVGMCRFRLGVCRNLCQLFQKMRFSPGKRRLLRVLRGALQHRSHWREEPRRVAFLVSCLFPALGEAGSVLNLAAPRGFPELFHASLGDSRRSAKRQPFEIEPFQVF